MTERAKLRQALKALHIYDDVVQELSCYVGHTYGRVGEQAHIYATEQCEKAMKAKRILDKLEGRQ